MEQDIRWAQRFSNYLQAFARLKAAVELHHTRPLSDLEKQGVIQAFEYTHELAWNVLKDYLNDQGFSKIVGSKDATREAFKTGLISEGELWMEMIQSRNMSSHTYNEILAEKVFTQTIDLYFPAFVQFAQHFTDRLESQQ